MCVLILQVTVFLPVDIPILNALSLVVTMLGIVNKHTVWLQTDQWYRKHRTDKHSMKFLTFNVALTSNTVILFSQNILISNGIPSN